MSGDFPFTGHHAGGIAPNLIPTPPVAIPEAPGAADATASLSPFTEAQNVDDIISRLTLDRPLSLFIPDRHKYPEFQFHIINDTATEMAAALRQGWQRVDSPELLKLFEDKVSGTDKTGKITRPVLMARSKKIGEIVAKRYRQQLQQMYSGLDPKKKEFNQKFAKNAQTVSEGDFSGDFWRIRV